MAAQLVDYAVRLQGRSSKTKEKARYELVLNWMIGSWLTSNETCIGSYCEVTKQISVEKLRTWSLLCFLILLRFLLQPRL